MSEESTLLAKISKDLKNLQNSLEEYGEETIYRVMEAHLQEIHEESFSELRQALDIVTEDSSSFLVTMMVNGRIPEEVRKLQTQENKRVFQFTTRLIAEFGSRVKKAHRLEVAGERLLETCQVGKLLNKGASNALVQLSFKREDGRSFQCLLLPEAIPEITQKLLQFVKTHFPKQIDQTQEFPDGSSHNSLGFKLEDQSG